MYLFDLRYRVAARILSLVMPFLDEYAVYGPLIGQKPPPPPRVNGGAMHIYNICMLMQRHNRKRQLASQPVNCVVVKGSH